MNTSTSTWHSWVTVLCWHCSCNPSINTLMSVWRRARTIWVRPWLQVKYNYLSLRLRPPEIILFQRVENCLIVSKLFQRFVAAHEYFATCSMSVTCEIKHWNNFEIISIFYFTCNRHQWLHVKYNTGVISTLFQNNFISHANGITLLDDLHNLSNLQRNMYLQSATRIIRPRRLNA